MNFRGHIQITAFILYPDRRNHKGCLEFLGDGLDFRREPLTGREQTVESIASLKTERSSEKGGWMSDEIYTEGLAQAG